MPEKIKIVKATAQTRKAIDEAKKKSDEKNGRSEGRPIGGSMIENVRIMAKKVISVDMDFTMPDINAKMIDKNCRSYRCCMCGTVYTRQKENFLSGVNSILWRGNNGYTPFCKSCGEILMLSYTKFYNGNEEHAIRHLCQIFDWYYCDSVSSMTRRQAQSAPARITMYPGKMNTIQASRRGNTFLDTIKDEQERREADEFGCGSLTSSDAWSDEESEIDKEDDEFVVTKDMIRAWGPGFSKEQYRYLEEEYNDWITKNVCNTKSQEELYHNIVLAQLDIRIARQNGGKVAEAQKALQDLMNSANILPRQNAENILADTQTFGTLLKKFEETDPIPEPDEKWRDVDGIRKYMNTWFRGGLAKALKIKNDNARLYEEAEEEFDKYTVAPVKINSSEQKQDSSIFDEEANKKGEDSNA